MYRDSWNNSPGMNTGFERTGVPTNHMEADGLISHILILVFMVPLIVFQLA